MEIIHRRAHAKLKDPAGGVDFDPSHMPSSEPDPLTGTHTEPRHPHATQLPAEDMEVPPRPSTPHPETTHRLPVTPHHRGLEDILDDLDHFSNAELASVGDGKGVYRENALLASIATYTGFFTALLSVAIWVTRCPACTLSLRPRALMPEISLGGAAGVGRDAEELV